MPLLHSRRLNHPQHFFSLLHFTRAHKVKHKETQKQHFCLLKSLNWQITVTELGRKQDKPITGGWPGKPTLESAAEIQTNNKKSCFPFQNALSVILLSVVFSSLENIPDNEISYMIWMKAASMMATPCQCSFRLSIKSRSFLGDVGPFPFRSQSEGLFLASTNTAAF